MVIERNIIGPKIWPFAFYLPIHLSYWPIILLYMVIPFLLIVEQFIWSSQYYKIIIKKRPTFSKIELIKEDNLTKLFSDTNQNFSPQNRAMVPNSSNLRDSRRLPYSPIFAQCNKIFWKLWCPARLISSIKLHQPYFYCCMLKHLN